MLPMIPLEVAPVWLTTLWFALIVVLWIGYFFLEGFDYGVAMLLPILGKRDKDRRVMINTIGPVWDGNEVWLLTAGGATFAAFPGWYATLFSALYLPLLLVLLGLILRGVAFEYRGKKDSASWRAMFDWFAAIGSFLPALVFGVGLANFMIGLPTNDKMLFSGTFLALFSPFGLLGGLTLVAICLTHGAIFLALKTRGEVRDRARDFVGKAGIAAAALMLIFGIWGPPAASNGMVHSVPAALNFVLGIASAVCIALAVLFTRKGRDGLAFLLMGLAIVLLVLDVFTRMYPNLGFNSSAAQGHVLDLTSAASTSMTLMIMTAAAVVFVPVVLAYQGWTYWVFRRRLSTANLPGGDDEHDKDVRPTRAADADDAPRGGAHPANATS